VLKQRMRAKVV